MKRIITFLAAAILILFSATLVFAAASMDMNYESDNSLVTVLTAIGLLALGFAAATEDRNTVRQDGVIRAYKVKGSTKIYGGTLVCLDSTGYAIPAADTAGNVFVGFACAEADNSSGSSGDDLYVNVRKEGIFEITTAGAAITDVGRPVFVEEDNEVDIVNGNVIAGVIAKYVSATSVYIDIEPAVSGELKEKTHTIPMTLASIADGDMAKWTPGFAGTITKVSFAIVTLVTTAAKLSTLNLEIGTTNLTGGALALTSADLDAAGDVVAGSAITAENRFDADDVITVEAASTTTFIEGEGVLVITYV